MYLLHSWLRYAVFLLGLFTLAYAAWGLARKRPYEKRMWDLASLFAVGLWVQIVTGFFLIFTTTNRFFDRYLGLHMILSAAAAVSAQWTYSINRRRERGERSYLIHVWGVGLSLALVVVGLLAIRDSIFS